MATIFIIDPGYNLNISAATMVTVAGVVRAPNGAGLRRKIYIFNNNNMTAPLAIVESTALGSFSTTVSGLPTTEFTILAKGDTGENDGIYSHSRDF